jgi:hypothetical protein
MIAFLFVLLGIVSVVILPATRELVVSIIVGEVKGVLGDRLADAVRRAAAALPSELVDDFEEELLEDVPALRDRPITAIRYVKGLNQAAQQIATDWLPARVDRETHTTGLWVERVALEPRPPDLDPLLPGSYLVVVDRHNIVGRYHAGQSPETQLEHAVSEARPQEGITYADIAEVWKIVTYRPKPSQPRAFDVATEPRVVGG